MHNFRFVTKKEYQPIKEELLELIHLVQDEVREHFTFRYDFIGSASRNTITIDEDSNVGYDFDVNIEVNDPDNNYSPKKIRNILKTAFDKYAKSFGYSYAEDSKRVITIKVKDQKHKKILHSCDFAVVNNYEDENGDHRQQFIYFNKSQGTYEWQNQPIKFYEIPGMVYDIKQENLWNELKALYLEKKNNNDDIHKKSRSIWAESVNEIYMQYFDQE